MEIPTHSRQPNMVSKKSCNGVTTTASESIYVDVFGGVPKFGAPTLSPRVEDFSEIFGGFHTSRASSIPVLDLPLVDDEETDVFFDASSSGFDYTEVFGGCGGHDFAVSYEELMLMMGQFNGNDDSSDEAWTPAEADNLSGESDYFKKDQRISNGDSSESIDGCTSQLMPPGPVNISCNKASKKCNENLSNGIRRTMQLHDVSGYTFVPDKATSLPNSCYLRGKDDDDHSITDYSGEMLSGRHPKKMISQPAKDSSDGLFFGDDVAPHREFVRNGSMFLTISDVSLRTQPSDLPPPSRPPPALDVNKMTPNFRSVASEESTGDSSPPYFDVEVDASSSAAASAAAMKGAMKRAQEKLKRAKESIERKQEALCSCTKSNSRIGRRDKEEKATKLGNNSGSINGEGGGQGCIQRGVDNGIEFSIMEDNQKDKMTSRMTSDPLEGYYHLKIAKRSAEENILGDSFSFQGSDLIDVAGEWKEATQFFELATNKSKKVYDQEKDKTVLEHDSICYESQKKEKRVTEEGLWGHQENDGKVGADRELEHLEIKYGIPIRSFDCDKSVERSDAENKWKLLDKRVQVNEEACREERNENKFSIDLEHGENEKRRIRAHELQKHLAYVEVIEKASGQTLKHKDIGSQWKEDNRSMGNMKKFPRGKEDGDRISRHAFELEENEKKFKAIFELAENEIRQESVALLDEKEKTKKDVFDREENEKTLRGAVERKESERRQKEALEKEDNDRRLKENCENEERLRRHRKETELEENEERQKETRQREENEKRQRKLLKREANEKKLNEAKDKEENGRRLNENLEKEERQRRQSKATEREQNTKREREENEKRLKQALEKEEIQMRSEAIEKEENAKRERKENEKRLNQALDKEGMQRMQREAAVQENAEREHKENEMRLKEALDEEENKRRQKAAVHRRKNEKKQEETFVTDEHAKQQLEASKMRCIEAFEGEEIAKKIKGACDGGRREEVCQKPEYLMTSRYPGERATAEVRQRVLNDACERLEKSCPEARGKSFPDYSESIEARLRAERAAVERATAEARERAFEKAMAERTAFEARDRVDRSASDKFSASSTNSGIRPDSSSNDLHSQGAGISNGSKYQYSTVYSEGFGVEGESPQRCKARLERHRRMAERAANALEELNRRNLHAQREQAEKNRLAENLDADVKRWSSGKEGNLRALLSTLQYILGADSAWHPIPLTEVITAAAVKKAYRKATLCVHPDKLQQRGASIQQKYICEKVFDLLKEAWNKFNSEEW